MSPSRVLVSFLVVLLSGLAALDSAHAQMVNNQSFEITPEVSRATVGDTVAVRFRVRLDERDLLYDTIPQPVSELPPGVRLLSVDKMTRTPDRIFHGSARLAFYRTGRRAIPIFGVPFMRAVKGVQRATLSSDSAFVEIVPLLSAGNPSLKDIKELEPAPRRDFRPMLLAAIVALALGGMLWWRGRRKESSVVAPALPSLAPVPEPITPYQQALAELDRIERAGWPARGEVARHYEAAADVLRDYLEIAHGVPARERTSAELLWVLPPSLTESDGRDALADLLEEADMVKFAQYRPGPAAASDYLERSRGLLRLWHEAAARPEEIDAFR
jgi:hypothetical protein